MTLSKRLKHFAALQFNVEEVKLVTKDPNARRAIQVEEVKCEQTKEGRTAKPTLIFTAKVHSETSNRILTRWNLLAIVCCDMSCQEVFPKSVHVCYRD